MRPPNHQRLFRWSGPEPIHSAWSLEDVKQAVRGVRTVWGRAGALVRDGVCVDEEGAEEEQEGGGRGDVHGWSGRVGVCERGRAGLERGL